MTTNNTRKKTRFEIAMEEYRSGELGDAEVFLSNLIASKSK